MRDPKRIEQILSKLAKQVQIAKPVRSNLCEEFRKELERRIEQHGDLSFIDRHQGRGVIQEELVELDNELSRGTNGDIAKEAMDLAIAAFWLYASIQVNKV